jgi:hypothetical protein
MAGIGALPPFTGTAAKDPLPPGGAIRGPSRLSTALDPEPTAQADPLPPIDSVDGDGGPCPKAEGDPAPENRQGWVVLGP